MSHTHILELSFLYNDDREFDKHFHTKEGTNIFFMMMTENVTNSSIHNIYVILEYSAIYLVISLYPGIFPGTNSPASVILEYSPVFWISVFTQDTPTFLMKEASSS